MDKIIRTSCRIVVLLPLVCATGLAVAQAIDKRKVDRIDGSEVSTIPLAPRVCARPFRRTGTVELKSGYSGSVGEFTTPGDGILQVRSVKTSLRVPGLYASAIGTYRGGRFEWHPLRVETDVGHYSSSRDEPVYADRSSLLKIQINRNGGIGTAVWGDYELSGCLIDRIPERIRIPDAQLPRLPPKELTPLEPVERLKPVQTPRTDR